MTVQEKTDELVDGSCWHLAGNHAKETFEHFTKGLD